MSAYMNECKQYGGLSQGQILGNGIGISKGWTGMHLTTKGFCFFCYTCRARSESWQLVKDGKVGWTWMHLLSTKGFAFLYIKVRFLATGYGWKKGWTWMHLLSTKGLRRWPTNNCQDVILLFLHLTFQKVKSISLWFSLWDEYWISHFFLSLKLHIFKGVFQTKIQHLLGATANKQL